MTERHGHLAQIRNRAIARHHAATRSGRLNSPVLKASTIPATTPTTKIRRQNRAAAHKLSAVLHGLERKGLI